MAKLVLSKFVEPELNAIWAIISENNVDAADRFIDAAYGTMQTLAHAPEIGWLRTFHTVQISGLRSFRVKGFENYLIFYRPTGDGIEILHVFHGARDLETAMLEGRIPSD
jgi:toxin ParE1/3/4